MELGGLINREQKTKIKMCISLMKHYFRIASLLFIFFLVCCKKNPSGSSNVLPPPQDTIVPLSSYRPIFHYTPSSNWINDPNGLVYFNGAYHLFSQYNPLGNTWGNMSWGHATSNDLLSWQEQGVAIYQQTNPDNSTSMIFSGSAVVDSANSTGFATQAGQVPLVAVYTSNNTDKNGNAISQNQCIAYSLDNGITWTKYASNPVLDIQSTQFRDPKVFWYAPGNKWIMVVSKPDQYKVMFYSSTNLIQWTYMSAFGGQGNTTQVWECPDLYELSIENSNQKKWVLSVSGGGSQNGFGGMQYFIGNFDGNQFMADADNYPFYVDFGKDYYAGVTYNNIPNSDGRTVMIGWANNWNYAGNIPTVGYRGQYSIPRSLSLRQVANTNGYHLLQTPVLELNKFESNMDSIPTVTIADSVFKISNVSGTALDIQFHVSLNNATNAGIDFLKGGTQKTTVTFNKSSSQITLDRRYSGQIGFNAGFASIESAILDNGSFNNLDCRILIDQSIVEVFVNQGEYTLTDLVFPTQGNGEIDLFSVGGSTTFSNIVFKKIQKTIH